MKINLQSGQGQFRANVLTQLRIQCLSCWYTYITITNRFLIYCVPNRVFYTKTQKVEFTHVQKYISSNLNANNRVIAVRGEQQLFDLLVTWPVLISKKPSVVDTNTGDCIQSCNYVWAPIKWVKTSKLSMPEKLQW